MNRGAEVEFAEIAVAFDYNLGWQSREVAVELCVNESRVPQIKQRAFAKLRPGWEPGNSRGGRTLLYAVYHSGKTPPPRLSRHYYDLARLYRHEYGQNAITDSGCWQG